MPRLLTAVVVSSVAAFSVLTLGSYFLVNSSLGPKIVRALSGGDVVQVSAVRWGPAPSSLAFLDVRATNFRGEETFSAGVIWVRLGWEGVLPNAPTQLVLLDAVVRSDQQRPGIAASRLTADLDTTTAAARFRISKLRADNYVLNLRWPTQGEFNLAESFQFRPPKPPPVPVPGPDVAPGVPPGIPWVRVDDIVLSNGAIHLGWGSGSLSASEVRLSGAYGSRPTEGLRIDADLVAGASKLVLAGVGPDQQWSKLAINGYQMRGLRTVVREAFALGLVSSVTAPAAPVANNESGQDQRRLVFSDLDLSPTKVSGQVLVSLPELVAGEVAGTNVRALTEFHLVPRPPFLPAGKVSVLDASAGTLQGPGWRIVGAKAALAKVDVEGFGAQVSLGQASAVKAELTQVAAPSGPLTLHAPRLSGGGDISISRADFKGRLTTAHGEIQLQAQADISLIRQQVQVTMGLVGSNLSGGLAQLWRRLPARPAPKAATDLAGSPPSKLPHGGQGAEGSRDLPMTGTHRATLSATAPLGELLGGKWQPVFQRAPDPAAGAADAASNPKGAGSLAAPR